MQPNASGPARFTFTHALICIIASIGFAFDIYELLMLPLVIKPALAALGGAGPDGAPLLTPGSPGYTQWARMLFFIPALAGGVFGLLGGYLTDRLGRRRVLTFSILLYAFAACLAGYTTSLPQLLFLRCLVFIGVCVEFVAAVAWLAELFPNPVQREKVLGYTQAFSSLGGFMVAGANVLAAKWALDLPAIHGSHEAWRYTLISGVIPALPLLLIRPFLPESPEWQRKRDAGQLKRPSFAELFSPALCRTTVITTLVFASSYGLAFGAIQQLPQILGATKSGGGHKAIQATANAAREKAIADAKEAGKTRAARRQVGADRRQRLRRRRREGDRLAGSRRVGRARRPGVCRALRREPSPPVADVSVSGAPVCARVVLVDFRESVQRRFAAADQGGACRCRFLHRGAV